MLKYHIFVFDCNNKVISHYKRFTDESAQNLGRKIIKKGKCYYVVVTDWLGFKRLELYRDSTVYPAPTSRYMPPNGYNWDSEE